MTRHTVIRIGLLFTVVAILALCPLRITIGAKTYQRHVSYSQGNLTSYPFLYELVEFDGPTGSFESYKGYVVRFGKLVVHFGIVTNHLHNSGR